MHGMHLDLRLCNQFLILRHAFLREKLSQNKELVAKTENKHAANTLKTSVHNV
jgi:hypothetical protein